LNCGSREAAAAAAYKKRLKATVEARTRARARMMRCLFISVSFLLAREEFDGFPLLVLTS
jgi:hypothetical protein